jgi:hypothetical protein
MFALASDLLRYVRVNVQRSSPGNSDRCVQSSSAAAAGALWQWAAGWTFMAGRTPSARSPQRPGLTSRPVTCRWGCGTDERLDPDDIGSRGSGEEPHARRARAGPSAAGYGSASLSVISSAGRCGAELTGSLPVLGTGSPGTVRACARDRRHPNVPTWVASSAAGHRYLQSAFVVDGLPVWRLTGPPRRRLP